VKDSDSIDDMNDLPYIRLWRLIVPPETIHRQFDTAGLAKPYRNIAFNGFAYSLLNPTVAFVAANWISDYFTTGIQLPPQEEIKQGT
jgi:dimethylaniline monooxygenase (N-oxide forming)